jgi:alpha-amylase/alpha-mannosidase (GH57 family)
MHQPFYKDLISGEYKLPWTRLHALKDYYGMVRILEEFPAIRQTYNLVPSLMVQVDDYASGNAKDRLLSLALKPAEDLTPAEQDILLAHSFHADPPRMIYRLPRYGELFNAREAHRREPNARRYFRPQDYRDLQMLSQLAWFDEEFRSRDPEVRDWIARGRDFTLADQAAMGRKQREIVAQAAPQYEKLAASGQIEISTTPFYHPILPLLCDSNIAAVSHPNVPLPSRFRYPQDARMQLQLARDYIAGRFGKAPVGLWPSEGSVSDEVLELASDLNFEWTATDSGVLSRTLGHTASAGAIYRPYVWEQGKRRISIVFRDHFLSDLVGFVYAKMSAREAAEDFLRRIRENARPILAKGQNALVPIVLDGENAWEYYEENGRPFFRYLYSRLSGDDQIQTVTVAEALRLIEPQKLERIFPGSWINANFDVWIGAQEDNLAWEHLLRAREVYEQAKDNVPEANRKLAFEELLIAEGSDWCWWYGPEHHSDQRAEFDQLFRCHLANVYCALERRPPEELSRPILKALAVEEVREPPRGNVHAIIDGEATSYFEWIGAGIYRVDERSGSMHGKRFLVRELLFGTDGERLFIRVDFSKDDLQDTELRLVAMSESDGRQATAVLSLARSVAAVVEASPGIECAYRTYLEIAVPLESAGAKNGARVKFQFSLWQQGLPVHAVPAQGWIELESTDSSLYQ